MFSSYPSLIGKEIEGYRILEKLGRGGMGVVYKAINVDLDRFVALKLMTPQLAHNDEFVHRFRREARTLAHSSHPNIVLVYTFRQSEWGLCLVMEYVEGETLAAHLKKHGAIFWQRALPLMKQLLQAFAYAHNKGIIHRDVKPGNVMLTPDGTVKVMDFGLAKTLNEGSGQTTATGSFAGTLCYMSPEQIKGLKNMDQRSDLFSLGLTFYEMLSGRLPFEKTDSDYAIQRAIVEQTVKFPPPIQFQKHLPRPLSQIIMKALEKDPERRYQSAAAMLADLEAFEAKAEKKAQQAVRKPTEPVPVSLSQGKSLFRRKGFVGLLAGLLLLATTIFGYKLISDSEGSDRGPMPGSSPGAPLMSALRIESEPAGARVLIAGRFRGQTPLTLDSLEAGPYTVVLEKEGYERDTLSTTLETGLPAAPLMARLTPLPAPPAPEVGILVIESEPRGATVRLDGTRRGVTPLTLDSLPARAYQVVLERVGHQAHTLTARVAAGQEPTRVQARLTPLPATLRILPRPWGDIYVDGRLVRPAVDFRHAVEVPPGTRRVRVVNAEHGEWERQIDVPAAATRDLDVDFTQQIRLTITARTQSGEPVSGEIYIDGRGTGRYPPAELDVPLGRRRLAVRAEGYEVIPGNEYVMVDKSTPKIVRVPLQKQ